jgi:hypothetical protein
MRDRGRRWLVLLGAVLASHCRAEPPSTAAPTASAPPTPDPVPPAASVPASAASAAPGTDERAPSALAAGGAPAAPAAPAAAPGLEEPPLVGADGVALPQTEERPSVTSERFERRMRLLASSILSGDVEPARATFFPLVAYAQVKDVQKPERDYRYRLMAHFERDVREYHQKLGGDPEHATFLGVTVPEPRVEWMKPGREGNRLGYFRVLRSTLRFQLSNGKQQSFELTSMISWRGEWYVVHLHGFE